LESPILFEISGDVATITLNRADALNTIHIGLADALGDAVDAAEKSGARALLLKGAGRVFSAGGDIARFDDPKTYAEVANATMAQFHPAILKLAQSRLPTVAAVHGAVAGAGISMMLACDFAIAGAGTRFTLAYAMIGASLDGGASWFLPRAVGLRRAKELAMLSDVIDAATAERLGLINRVVGDDAVVGDASNLVRRLAAGPTAAFAAIKRQINSAAAADLEQQLDDERATLTRLAGGDDFAEGIAAYRSKRKPHFRGS
jgi:2-(1,2-epoxy-1,2-dihydrophenyl)acetyl-CoA isomerase